MHPCVAEETAYAAMAEGLVEVNAYERNKLPRLVASLAILIAISSVSLLSTAFVLWMSIPSAPDFQLSTLSMIPQTIQAPFTGNVPPMKYYVIPKPCLPLMVIAGVTGGVISAGAASLLIAILGFTGIGPAAGSVAGSWQAAAGAVTAGSLLSTLQSAAMGGYGVWVLINTGVATGPIVAAAAYAFCYHVCGDCGA